MKTIPVFKIEKDDGFTEKTFCQNALSYLVPIQSIESKKIELFTTASQDHIKKLFHDQTDFNSLDLYDLSSILVSTVWNGNDDVFEKGEVWASRKTPIHKPLNLEHQCDNIIGHMIDICPVDEELKVVDENLSLDELPTCYHLLSRAVLYKFWSKEDKQEEIDKILKEISENKWFVSVEALFSNFDYAIQNAKEVKIVNRNEKTAFLTKYLRAYGGVGVFKDCRVGRVLRNIIFSGKGLVKRPANSQSIIFAKKHNFENAVYTFTIESTQNKEVNMITEQEQALKDQVSKLEATLKEVPDKIKALEDNLKNKENDIVNLKDQVSKLEASLKSSNEETVTLRTKLDETEKSRNELKVNLEKIEAEKKYNDRLALIVSKCSVDNEKAKKILDTINSLGDKEFEAFLVTQVELIKASQVVLTDAQKADTTVLDSINKKDNKDVALNNKSDDSGVEQVRAGIANYLAGFLGLESEDNK